MTVGINSSILELTFNEIVFQVIYGSWRRGQIGDSPYNVKVFFTYGREGKHIELSMSHRGRDKMYVDYTGGKLSIVDKETGEIIDVEVFVSVLGYSGLTFVKACASQKKEDFLPSIADALSIMENPPKYWFPII